MHSDARYAQAVLDQRTQAAKLGTFRDKARFDLIGRPNYACGLLMASDLARFCGLSKISALEFGVADGNGLLNLCELARMVTSETGVEIEVVGFDTGNGLPAPRDYRDHPEIWQEGDFATHDREGLLARLPSHGRIIWGDIADTVTPFLNTISPDRPIGFVSIDVDIYSSTKDALVGFLGDPSSLLPAVVTYFDDTLGSPGRIGSLFRNLYAGQFLAIEEFNREQERRKIDRLRILKYRRPLDREQWLDQMYAVHVLDHPLRNRIKARCSLNMQEHAESEGFKWEW